MHFNTNFANSFRKGSLGVKNQITLLFLAWQTSRKCNSKFLACELKNPFVRDHSNQSYVYVVVTN